MIAIFGASVTQQKTGYAYELRTKFNCPVKIFGFGAMHLSNAAICYLNKIVLERPSYCFLDWFSTGYNFTNEKTILYIDTIIYKFSEIQCKLIFLFFPYRNSNKKEEFYSFCKSVLRRRGIEFIDLTHNLMKQDLDEILKDDIHTTELGSKLYSELIYSRFEKIKDRISIPVEIAPTKYVHIKKISINRAFSKKIQLYGNCEIIGFLLTIGPHSGIVKIENRKETQIQNTWDKWCYYQREQFDLGMEITGKAKVSILQNNFDTSSCRKPYNFEIEKKKLIVHEIFYVGESLVLDDYLEGQRVRDHSLVHNNSCDRMLNNKNKFIKKLWKIIN
jgi:hypothetical protein